MTESPLVSVVMGVYNGEHYLAESIDSILAQEGVDFEFVVVNDGSTDDSLHILERYAAQDARLRVIHQENRGLTKALIRGCGEARGIFIARQDADDISMPGRLQAQASILKHDDALAFVSCWANWIGPEGEFLFTLKPDADPARATQQILYEMSGPPAHGTVMFRRQAYERAGGYRAQFQFAQDSDLWRRLGHIGQIAYVHQILYEYRVGLDSISNQKRQLQGEYDRLAHACHRARLAGEDENPLLSEAFQLGLQPRRTVKPDATLEYFIGRCLARNYDRRALNYLRRAIRVSPWKIRSWIMLAFASVTARDLKI